MSNPEHVAEPALRTLALKRGGLMSRGPLALTWLASGFIGAIFLLPWNWC